MVENASESPDDTPSFNPWLKYIIKGNNRIQHKGAKEIFHVLFVFVLDGDVIFLFSKHTFYYMNLCNIMNVRYSKMTEKGKKNKEKSATVSAGLSAFHLEADRTAKGMSLVLCGIIGISDFSDNLVVLLSHGGRISVSGKRLFISVFEGGSVEIVGRVEEINFRYGKN